MADLKRWVYDHSPILIQNFMCTVSGRVRVRQRYDSKFEESRCFFREASQWSRRQAEEYQQTKLVKFVNHCYENVPYYQKLFDAIGIRARDIKSIKDFKCIPILSKEEMKKAGEDLIARNYKRKDLIMTQSGGSTGLPTVCWHDKDCLADVYAHFWECHRPGVKPKDKYATFQGMELIPKSQKGGPYWRMNRAMHQRLYSIYHLSLDTIEDYIRNIDSYQPVYMAGYSNSLYLLAQLAREKGIVPKWHPKAVFTTSEQLLNSYRQTIEDVFKTRVWDAYSQDEQCGSISEYECGYYHYDRAYGFMEFENKEEAGSGRKVAEIICTGFLNKAYPLLRYRIGDMVEYQDTEYCPKCGRVGPIIHEIRGRTGDVIVTAGGRYFPHISLVVKNLHGVRQVQVVQNAIDKITIRYVTSEDFRGEEDEKLILKNFNEALGEKIEWMLERMDEIPLTSGGKFMSIINNLNK